MYSIAGTPCPVYQQDPTRFEDNLTDELTANIEYTTAFQASFRHVRPKRAGPIRRKAAPIVIHEDVVDEVVQVPASIKPAAQNPPLSKLLVSQPARRAPTVARPRFSIVEVPALKSEDARENKSSLSQQKSSPVAQKHVQATRSSHAKPGHACSAAHSPTRGAARRKTLYIPSEDTTQPSVWMGVFGSVKHEARINGKQSEDDLTGIAARMAEKRRRTTASSDRPRRMPLKQNFSVQERVGQSPDRAGAPTGKENVPPAQQKTDQPVQKAPRIIGKSSLMVEKDVERKKFLSQARLARLNQAESRPSMDSEDVLYEVGTRRSSPRLKRASNCSANAETIENSDSTTKKGAILDGLHQRMEKQAMSSKPEPPHFLADTNSHDLVTEYHSPPVANADDLAHPELYEEKWLQYQETVLIKWMNTVLEPANGLQTISYDKLYADLFTLYDSPEFRLSAKKVEDSIFYGALSFSHEGLLEAQSLSRDVQRKQDYMDLWLENYHSSLLAIALEVITGEPMPRSDEELLSSLAKYIDDFVLKHKEAHFKIAGTGALSKDLGHRTLFKSLMLVKVLDMLQEQLLSHKRCFFMSTATVTSSQESVRALLQMLNPAVGDPVKALRLLGFEVSSQASNIAEFPPLVANLATDLRDGLQLTRLASALSIIEPISIPRASLTLKQKLTRATKESALCWVDYALEGFRSTRSIGPLLHDIKAQDILDGHREKTIYLLWVIAARSDVRS